MNNIPSIEDLRKITDVPHMERVAMKFNVSVRDVASAVAGYKIPGVDLDELIMIGSLAIEADCGWISDSLLEDLMEEN